MFIDGANRTFEGNPFNYTQDPTIMEIKPLKSFASGGRMITVHGTNFNTIQKPEMVVYTENEQNPVSKSVSNFFFVKGTSALLNIRIKKGFSKEFRILKSIEANGDCNFSFRCVLL